MEFANVYEDAQRAAAYATLEFPGTYYLAFRDLPEIIRKHVTAKLALDFGCGAGRSTRFLKSIGLDSIGVDISEDMLKLARARDPEGEYLLSQPDHLVGLDHHNFDVILSAFTFDNIPGMDTKVRLFTELRDLLSPTGRIVNLVSSPEIYTHDWASFLDTCFEGNFTAKRGDFVYTIMTDVPDSRPVQDILWPDDAYRETFTAAGLAVEEVYKPLGRLDDPCVWVNETTVAPWTIYVLKASR
jgi:ubiquinone/menaquinone biosynthesis C-methylase UbiE